jgi:hypothetical protein
MMVRDERRTARLLFAEELADGRVTDAALQRREVVDAVRARPVPSPPSRLLQRLALKRGTLTYEGAVVAPALAARRAVLGDDAAARPRFLVRVDEFPHWKAWAEPEVSTEAYRRFHAILRDAGVPYLLAVVPRTARAPEDPDVTEVRGLEAEQVALLDHLKGDDVVFAVHGLDHRTRNANPRRYTELGGRKQADLVALLETARELFDALELPTRTLVPPFNTFDARTWPALAERFDVVTGGPESLRSMGFHPTPQWRGDAVYLPAYAPLYGTAAEVLPAVERLAAARTGLWTPIVLHWGWERERGWSDLERLAAVLGGDALARPFDEFLAAVDLSRTFRDA